MDLPRLVMVGLSWMEMMDFSVGMVVLLWWWLFGRSGRVFFLRCVVDVFCSRWWWISFGEDGGGCLVE